MSLLLDALSWVLLMGGIFLGISGALGLFRFPDFYTRLHAAGITDTLCAASILAGLALQAGWSLVSVKLVIILFFLFFTNPVASHALASAALHSGLAPRLAEEDGSSSPS